MKRCSVCSTEKSLDDFHRNKGSGDGRVSRCKTCVSAYQTQLKENKRLGLWKPGMPKNSRLTPDGSVLKKCTRCGEEKNLDSYYTLPSGSLYGHCKECHKLYSAEIHKRRGRRSNEDERLKKRMQQYHADPFFHLMRGKAYKYKITVEEATRLSTSPCEMCGSEDSGVEGATMFIDHNHTTGEVRGGLCRRCNFYVGWRENHQELETAYNQYAKKYGRRYE